MLRSDFGKATVFRITNVGWGAAYFRWLGCFFKEQDANWRGQRIFAS